MLSSAPMTLIDACRIWLVVRAWFRSGFALIGRQRRHFADLPRMTRNCSTTTSGDNVGAAADILGGHRIPRFLITIGIMS